MPGPGSYQTIEFKSEAPAATFGNGAVPSDLDVRIRRSAALPGPGQYARSPSEFQSDTPAFSMGQFKPKSDLDWQIHRAKQLPGPGEYDVRGMQRTVPKTAAQVRRSIARVRQAVEGSLSRHSIGASSDVMRTPGGVGHPARRAAGTGSARTRPRSAQAGNSAGRSRSAGGRNDGSGSEGDEAAAEEAAAEAAEAEDAYSDFGGGQDSDVRWEEMGFDAKDAAILREAAARDKRAARARDEAVDIPDETEAVA